MARTTLKSLQARIDELEAQNSALRAELNGANARIERGHQLVRQLKAEHLESMRQANLVIAHYTQQPVAQPATPNSMPAPRAAGPVAQPGTRVSRFTRGGFLYEKHRVGNKATEHCLGRVALNAAH